MLLSILASTLILLLFTPLPIRPNSQTSLSSTSASDYIQKAQSLLESQDVNGAFRSLSQAYALDPNAQGLQSAFEACLRTQIGLAEDEERKAQDRFGLASLLIDQERHEEAATELRKIQSTTSSPSHFLDKVTAMLYRTKASACDWEGIDNDNQSLLDSIHRFHSSAQQQFNNGKEALPPVHPFEALKWPCIGLEDATMVASTYSIRARSNVASDETPPAWNVIAEPVTITRPFKKPKKIKLGYISPDFTGKHPLAFLMQDVFRLHDRSHFTIHLYSLSKEDASPEVQKIKQGCDAWTELPPSATSEQIASRISGEKLDILVDLCGHAGTATVAEVMARRAAPIQISYMGFPGSMGDLHDYLICDGTVIPFEEDIRRHYAERLIVMPHCYFVNSHKHSVEGGVRIEKRKECGLPEEGFVYCCHSRPDKIDPETFRTWLKALQHVRDIGNRTSDPKQADAVLWLLRSGNEMEKNLRSIAEQEFDLPSKALQFVDVVPRSEHLERLALADLFCDTPQYNAHTLGCDTLFLGVPMISLLRPSSSEVEGIQTDKLASRVGASLLKAAGLPDLIVPDMDAYADAMISCATNAEWFDDVKKRLEKNRFICPLFDTERWVRNMEFGLQEILVQSESLIKRDVVIVDCDPSEQDT